MFLADLTLPGDANCDCEVDVDDMNIVLGEWGEPGPDGDFNLDGEVDVDDLNIVLSNSTATCP